MKPAVLIIGAGIAGLRVAAELARRRVPCVIIEARQRIGGRVWSATDRDFPFPVELGAEFIHGFPDETLRLARRHDLALYEVPDRHLFRDATEAGRRGRLREVPDFWERIDRGVGGKPRGAHDLSFARQLARKRLPARDRLLARSFVEGFHAADPDEISQRSLADEGEATERIEANRALRVEGGYGSLGAALLDEAPPGMLRLILGSPVRRLDWERGQVAATIEAGPRRTAVVRARAAVITLPPGPLARLGIFPELPAKRSALESLRSGAVLKLVARFERPFWERKTGHDLSFLHTGDRIFPTWWSTAPFRWPVLTGWTGGPPARELAGCSERDLRDAACAALARALGMSRAGVAAELRALRFHDWQSDPWAEGAYSYVKVGGTGAPARLARPVRGTLFFAGEATDAQGVNGTVEGALASGARAARQVAGALAA